MYVLKGEQQIPLIRRRNSVHIKTPINGTKLN